MANDASQSDVIGLSDIRRFYDSDALHRIESMRSRETFMELCRIRTWETAHSSFLKWLFSNAEFARLSLSPVINLLRLYASKAVEQGTNGIDPGILNEFLSGGVRYVGNVRGEVELSTDNKRRIDLELVFEYSDGRKLRVCVENKLYSSEHDDQCAAYYKHYQDKVKADAVTTIFIFLSPDKENRTAEEHFVNLTYQEVYDSVLRPLRECYAEHHCGRSIRYVDDYIETLTSIRNDYNPIVMSSEYKDLLKQIYDNHSDLFMEVIRVHGTEEEKKLVKESTGGNIRYTVTMPNGETESVTGFTRMARTVVQKLADLNVDPQELVRKLRKVWVPNFDSEGICFSDDKGAESRYSSTPVETSKGLFIYISNQWRKNKADEFIKLVEANFPIKITATSI